MPRLIVNADDFGRSRSINEAVIRAHQEGILTTTSLMVNEVAFDEAVELAKKNPKLGVGLHLTLVCGHSTLPRDKVPGLVDEQRNFSNNAPAAGFGYFISRDLRGQLEEEINAQFERFQKTGLKLDHVNGHLNIHLHPTIFSILMTNAERWRIRHLRFTHDPLRISLKTSSGQWLYRLMHAAIYRMLSQRARPALLARKIRHTEHVFGMLQNARVNENYIRELLPLLPAGDSELYSHPSLDEFKHEFDALVSPRVKLLVQQFGIELIRYQDL